MAALTAAQKRVLKVVRRRQRFNLRELAERAGISEDAARHYAGKLEAAGHFVRVSGGGRGVEVMLQRVA